MSLSQEEKAMIGEALQVYLQIAARQVGAAQAQELVTIAQGIIKKLDSVGAGGKAGDGPKPAGITDEWFKQVCQKCDKLSASGCTDKVTIKYPGKCDPILKFEREKLLKGKK